MKLDSRWGLIAGCAVVLLLEAPITLDLVSAEWKGAYVVRAEAAPADAPAVEAVRTAAEPSARDVPIRSAALVHDPLRDF